MVLGAGCQFICSLDRPRTAEEWGEVLARLFAMYYTFGCEYPPGLQAGMLMWQSLAIEPLSGDDAKDANAVGMDVHLSKYHDWLLDYEKSSDSEPAEIGKTDQ